MITDQILVSLIVEILLKGHDFLSKWLRHTIELIVTVIILIGVAIAYNTDQVFPVQNHIKIERENNAAHRRAAIRPILYVGSRNSTHHLLEVGAKAGGHQQMQIIVHNNQIKYQGHLVKHEDYPMVEITFMDHGLPIPQRVQDLQRILHHLQTKEHCHEYDAISYSVSSLAVLQAAAAKGQHLPRLCKFVSIGAPFRSLNTQNTKINLSNKLKNQQFNNQNLNQNNYNQNNSQVSANPVKLRRLTPNLPKHLQILNLYGCVNDRMNSDGVVPVMSARSLRLLVKHHTQSYEAIRLNGRYASHHLLIDNSVVDQLISRFMF